MGGFSQVLRPTKVNRHFIIFEAVIQFRKPSMRRFCFSFARLLLIFLALPWVAQAQLLSNYADELKKTILDAEAVQQAAKQFPLLSEEYAALNTQLDQLKPMAGYQRNYLPIEIQPLVGDLESKVAKVCSNLRDLMDACRAKLKADTQPVEAKLFANRETILRDNPGCYYMGLNDQPLCEHDLGMVMTSIQLQDYPFAEAAEADECLWDMAGNAPRLAEIIAFGCDIDDATLVDMHLEKCNWLQVLELDENALTQVPLSLFETGKLKSLSLSKNKITHFPADLKPLSGLLYLELYGNPIPEEELARIKKALPNTTVMFR